MSIEMIYYGEIYTLTKNAPLCIKNISNEMEKRKGCTKRYWMDV